MSKFILLDSVIYNTSFIESVSIENTLPMMDSYIGSKEGDRYIVKLFFVDGFADVFKSNYHEEAAIEMDRIFGLLNS
tara:strand:- start:3203 stop:3433 length:231 start_codon:yes stop_codon:yes gene_type:complete